MDTVTRQLLEWWRAGEAVGLATVCETWHSSPRGAGSIMIVGPDGSVSGSVSGGCVEGAVYESCVEAVSSGRARLEHFGVSNDDAFAVGLTCGGQIDVFVESASQETYPELAEALDDVNPPLGVATVIEHPDPARLGRHLVVRGDSRVGSLGALALDDAITATVRGWGAGARSTTLRFADGELPGEGATRVFVRPPTQPARLIVFGSSDLTGALATLGRFAGYHVTVCDARPLFATPERFPYAAEVVVDWPHRYLLAEAAAGRIDGRTAVAVLTHDPKFDVPVIETALQLPVAYLGLLGSRRTCADRRQRLLDRGVAEADLARLRAPLGLDIGGHSIEETAVSIVAEMIALRYGGTGAPLSSITAPIHR